MTMSGLSYWIVGKGFYVLSLDSEIVTQLLCLRSDSESHPVWSGSTRRAYIHILVAVKCQLFLHLCSKTYIDLTHTKTNET